LELRNRQITDLTPLKGLTNLRTLFLSGNPIPAAQVEMLR
jgi:Leucine-rich repeat (LRR) protein|tara:strand:- start:648 stop:767 length:120 start_codon:yes stop_codon:yes gene_type:complete